jgi:hypothetical protein
LQFNILQFFVVFRLLLLCFVEFGRLEPRSFPIQYNYPSIYVSYRTFHRSSYSLSRPFLNLIFYYFHWPVKKNLRFFRENNACSTWIPFLDSLKVLKSELCRGAKRLCGSSLQVTSILKMALWVFSWRTLEAKGGVSVFLVLKRNYWEGAGILCESHNLLVSLHKPATS